jgi:S1-C subfamily serine protease
MIFSQTNWVGISSAIASSQSSNIESTIVVNCESSRGTGFAVRENLYMTAKHVTEDCAKITLTNNAGKTVVGKIVFEDPYIDLALISTEEQISKMTDFSSVEISSGDVEIVGSPIEGLVLSIGKITGLTTTGEVSEIRLKIAADHGNSGGPVFFQNKLIGMVYKKNFVTGEVIAVALPSLKSGLDHYDLAILQGSESKRADIEIFGSNVSQVNLLIVSLLVNLLAILVFVGVYLRNKRGRYIVSRKRITVRLN